MNPEEKWKRLNNPKSAADYGISLNANELASFSEGREVLSQLQLASDKANQQEDLVSKLAENANDTLERVRYGALTAFAR